MNLGTTALIRPMSAKDLDRVIEIAAPLEHAPHWPRASYEAIFDPEKPRRVALVVERPGAGLIGFAIALVTPPDAELESIAVMTDSQRRGVARRLFDEITEVVSRLSVAQISLEVRASNLAALGFYRALGFLEVGKRHGYYVDPTEDAVMMQLGIGQ